MVEKKDKKNQPSGGRHQKREKEDVFQRKAVKYLVGFYHYQYFGRRGQGPGHSDEGAAVSQIFQVDRKKAVIGPVADQHQKGTKQKYKDASVQQTFGSSG